MTSTFLRPLSNGEILDGAFAIYRQNFTTFLGTLCVLMGPALVFAILASATDSEDAAALLYLSFLLLQGIATLAASGACVWIASETVLGRPVTVGQALGKGLRKLFPVFVATITVGILVFLGVCLLIVPGVLIGIVLFASVPIVVVEDRWDFIPRSHELAHRSWLKIFVVTLVYSIIVAMPGALLQVGGILTQAQSDFMMPLWLTAGSLLVSALTTPYASSAQTLLYYDQRVRKDGLDVELAASAVDSLPSAG